MVFIGGSRLHILFIVFQVCVILLITPGSTAGAEGALELSPKEPLTYLAPYVDVLKDPDGRLTIDQVTSLEYSNKFMPYTEKTFRSDSSDSVYWLRFRLAPREPHSGIVGERLLEISEPLVDDVDFYIPKVMAKPGEKVTRDLAHEKGRWQEGRDSDLPYRTTVFYLPEITDSNTYLYLRIKNRAALSVPLWIWTTDAFHRQVLDNFLIMGALYGGLLAMVLFNLSFFAALKDSTYLFYMAFILSILLFQVTLLGQLGFWMEISADAEWTFFWIFLGATLVTAAQFTRSFLRTRAKMPKIDWVMRIFIALALGLTIFGLAGQDALAVIIARVLFPVGAAAAFAAAYIRLKHGFKPARYFFPAWAVILIGAVIFALETQVGFDSYAIEVYALPVSVTLASILLSFALVDRIRTLRKERAYLEVSEKRFRELSLLDDLTGLYNKRYLNSRLVSEVDHAKRVGQPLSLILLDVDHFKEFNDNYGHLAGDEVLRHVGAVMRAVVREGDSPCRYGGEEFVMVLPGADIDSSWRVAERIRPVISEQIFKCGRERVTVTVSIGLAELKPNESGEDLIRRADEALYRAKNQGRDRTIKAV